MKAIIENAQIIELREALARSRDDGAPQETICELLRVLEWRDSGPAVAKGEQPRRSCYLRSNATAGYFQLDLEEKIRFETACWVSALDRALRGDGRPLRWLSPNLCEICRSSPMESTVVLARTLRMERLLQALLLDPEYPPDNRYRTVCGAVMSPKLRKLVAKLKGTTAPLGPGKLESWHVSMPLLLIVAVAESQCEHAQPFAWEAFCAGRAHEELKRKWGDVDQKVLNTVALLIRCQSVVGQRMRGTGGGRLLRSVAQGANELCFPIDAIYKALTLLAIVGEARNHRVPGVTRPEDECQNADTDRQWDEPTSFPDQSGVYLGL